MTRLINAIKDAARTGAFDEALTLITDRETSGVDLNSRDTDGNTALHYAAKFGFTNIIRALTDAKVEINALNREGNTATYIATKYAKNDAVKILLAAETRSAPAEVDIEAQIKFLNEKYDMDIQDAEHALTFAAYKDETSTIKTLLPNPEALLGDDAALAHTLEAALGEAASQNHLEALKVILPYARLALGENFGKAIGNTLKKSPCPDTKNLESVTLLLEYFDEIPDKSFIYQAIRNAYHNNDKDVVTTYLICVEENEGAIPEETVSKIAQWSQEHGEGAAGTAAGTIEDSHEADVAGKESPSSDSDSDW